VWNGNIEHAWGIFLFIIRMADHVFFGASYLLAADSLSKGISPGNMTTRVVLILAFIDGIFWIIMHDFSGILHASLALTLIYLTAQEDFRSLRD
jgi:hypothetical protein